MAIMALIGKMFLIVMGYKFFKEDNCHLDKKEVKEAFFIFDKA